MTDERQGKHSAGGAEQADFCPASFLRQKAFPRNDTRWSISGTRVHDWLAGIVVAALTPEEQATAEECKFLVHSLCWQLGLNPANATREQRFWAVQDLFSAKLDLVIRDGTKALAVDYKTGFNEVTPAGDNLQMRWQFLAAYNGEKEFYVAIIAPHGEQKITLACYKPEHYLPSLEQARGIIARAEDPQARAIPGTKQCLYCRAKDSCAEHQAWARQVLPAEIRELPVGAWTADQCVRFVVAAKAGKKMIDDKLVELRERLEAAPDSIPGLRLASNGSTRTIADYSAALDVLLGGLTEQQLDACSTLSVAKLEDAYRERFGLTKKQASAKLVETLGPLLETKPKAKSVEVL